MMTASENGRTDIVTINSRFLSNCANGASIGGTVSDGARVVNLTGNGGTFNNSGSQMLPKTSSVRLLLNASSTLSGRTGLSAGTLSLDNGAPRLGGLNIAGGTLMTSAHLMIGNTIAVTKWVEQFDLLAA